MVFCFEESIAAVCAPSSSSHADLLSCQAVFESNRYFIYAVDSLIVVLVEAFPASSGVPRFELWQVWHAQGVIRCVRFNASQKYACGALALCINDGIGVLLMPASAMSSRAAAVSRASTLNDQTGLLRPSMALSSNAILGSDYVKAHLYLHLPRWTESVRWQCDDRLLNHVEWVESGDDLFLLGVGEKLSIWKLVDVQLYLQRTVTLGGGGGLGVDTPLTVMAVCHFDVAPSGNFVATACKNDRIVKVWDLSHLSPHEGAPMCMFLAHTRALISITWSKDYNVYGTWSTNQRTTEACQMLFTLDRAGNISIWREGVAPLKSFMLWKQYTFADVYLPFLSKDDATLEAHIRVFGLINHYWTRDKPVAFKSIKEALLCESTVMNALCLYYYGCGSLNEAHQISQLSQHMESMTNMKVKLLGERSGAMADTPVGEAFICGNVALERTFVVNLLFGVLSNGGFCIFRVETVYFTGVSSKLSCLLYYSDLCEQLVDAHVFSVYSSDYQDEETSLAGFYVEVLFQQKNRSTYLQCAKLKIQAESSTTSTIRGNVSYSVKNCEVYTVCCNMMSAVRDRDNQAVSISVANIKPRSQANLAGSAVKVAMTNVGGELTIILASASLRRLHVSYRSKIGNDVSPVTYTSLVEEQGVLYLLISGKLHVAMAAPSKTQQETKVNERAYVEPNGTQTRSLLSFVERDALVLAVCYAEEDNEFYMSNELIVVDVSDYVKLEWLKSSSYFCQSGKGSITKDYSMVIGLHKGKSKLTVWVFSIETISPFSVELFRKTIVDIPVTEVLSVASVPMLSTFQIMFATFDINSLLTFWTLADFGNSLAAKPVHRVDVGALLRMASQLQEAHVEFNVSEEKLTFKNFTISICGRVAILFEGGKGEANDKVCFLPTMGYLMEGVVNLSHKQFGQVKALEWTPPITPERDCELLFLSTTTIGMLKFDCLLLVNKWSVAWSFSRFSVTPENVSSLSGYPCGLLCVGPNLAHLNLRDIDGSRSPRPHQPFASSIHPRRQPLTLQPPSKALSAHHPITLMYLLTRGSFKTLQNVLNFVKEEISEHEKMCYLRMTDDAVLQTLPLPSLSQLLEIESEHDELLDVYRRGKGNWENKGAKYGAVSLAPARASDLFTMDFGVSCLHDRADMLYAAPPASSQNISPTTKVEAILKSKLETDELSVFFHEHQNSLTFMTNEESNVFLTIIAGIKKNVSWAHDDSRQKDEAALRFHASLLWPVNLPASSVSSPPTGTYTEIPNQKSKNARTLSNRAVNGLCSEQVAWGALSDFQPELLQECFPAVTMSWNEMRGSRLPFWLKSSAKLTHFVEKVAQAEYAANRDPFAAALFYVLLKKTRLLASLFKMANETRIAELLSNDFTDLRWKRAAIKNAYVLKTKQRYELSAAFFLLGSKISEAVSVAEKADETLVLSFLIARISTKWDLGGQNNSLGGPGVNKPLMPFTASSSSLWGLKGPYEMDLSTRNSEDDLLEATNLCLDFLRVTVWDKAVKCGDVYMCFLVKYYLGEFDNAINMLITPPAIEMRCIFNDLGVDFSNMYWSAFGKSLLGACDLVRFLWKTIAPMRLALKESVIRLNTLAIIQMQGMGLGICALLHQRDLASFIQSVRRERAASSDVATFLAYRQRILIAAVGSQVDFLYANFLKSIHEALITPASLATNTRFDFEDRLNEEIKCIVRHGGDYDLPEAPDEHLKHTIQTAVVESLISSGRLAALDFLVSGWKKSGGPTPQFGFTSPLPQFVEAIVEGITTVALGDLISTAADNVHTRKVDQTCSNLLTTAMRLLLWLQYSYLKQPKQQAALPNRDFIRVVVAAVHSAICICCRYLKTPCCLNRVLGLIFSHKSGLSSSSQKALNDITSGDVCVTCASLRRPTTELPGLHDGASFQQDIHMLYKAVCVLEVELDEFTAAVKKGRRYYSMPSRESPIHLYSYCSYWVLVLTMAAGEMPNHLLKLAGDDIALTANLFRKLVQAWKTYSDRIASFALKHLLCDLAGVFFHSQSVAPPLASPGSALPGSPRGSASPSHRSVTGSPRVFFAKASESPFSPHQVLLKCVCQSCPWLILLELFTDKHELVLSLNAQFECCNKIVDEEVRWGRLPEPASRKTALTRSQKLLLSPAPDSTPTFSRAVKFADQLKRRTMSMPTAAEHVQCVYRSETTIKAMCFNRAVCDDVGVNVCSKKGILRASCVDYADGCRLQFKGMYAPPQSSFYSSEAAQFSPIKKQIDAGQRGGSSILSSMTTHSPPSPLRNSAHMLASPSGPSFKPTAVASHPFLPLFVSGNYKGRVHLWSFDRLSSLCAFQTKETVAPYPTSPTMLSGWRSVKALEFDNLGHQLAAVDAMGHLFMWKFSELDRAPYYCQIGCHDKGAKGLAFLNSSSSLATIGTSSEKRNLCVWDTLLPTSRALIATPACHPAGATAIAFSSTHQLLITGGAGGALSIFDIRQRRVLHTISNAHETPIKTIVLHPSGDCVLSGSAGGDVKIWSLPLFREISFLSKVHVKPSFLGDAATNFLGDAASNAAINVTNSSWGVTDAVATKDAFFTSGTDGSVQRLKVPSLGTRL